MSAAVAKGLVPKTSLQATMFRLGDRLMGIEISAIREINRVGKITPVPDAPAKVRGVINLRGEVVTVLDLRAILGMDATEVTTSSRLMIVPSENEHIALLVDRVEDVITVSSTDEEDLPANAGDLDGRYFRSVYKLEHELLILLDVVAVFVDDASRR